jgi:hypothetical protein
MADPTRWVGTTDIKQGKVKWRFATQDYGLDVMYAGPLSILLARRPALGVEIEGFAGFGLKVNQVEINELDGNAGEMIVQLSAPLGDTISTTPLGDPVYEIEFAELQRPLELHIKCGILKPNRPQNPTLRRVATWEDWAQLTAADYDDSGGKWPLATYQAKRELGIETFLTAAPVVRRTIYYFHNPSGVGQDCFIRENPPGAALAPSQLQNSGLVWLKGTDKITRQGRLRTRITEWLGAWHWDTDIYP